MSLFKRRLEAIREWGEFWGFMLLAGAGRLVSGKSPFGWEEDED